MKKIEKDYEYLETSPEAAAMGLRRITRPKSLDARLGKTPDKKSRVTIYFDKDIIERFKEKGMAEGIGYQTLMNNVLRNFVDGSLSAVDKMKEELLSDKKFLKRLNSELARQ